MAMIDLDHNQSAPSDPTHQLPVRIWLRAIAAAAAVGAVITLVAATAGWLAGSRAVQAQPQDHAVVLHADGPAMTAVYHRDGTAALAPPGETLHVTDAAGAAVAITAPADGRASCEITVDGRQVDIATASRGGTALCVWIADANAGVWVPAVQN